MNPIDRVVQAHKKSGPIPAFGPGDQVRVWYRIREKDRIRQVQFEGIVIRRRGGGTAETCTVRRMTHGEGVERVFPLHAPVVERIEVLRQGKVRRARLYYLRTKVGKTRLPAQGSTGQAGIASGETVGSSTQSANGSAGTPPPSAPPSTQPPPA